MKIFFISAFVILFLYFLSGCSMNNEQKTITNLNCLTDENFTLVANHIKNNGSNNTYSINDWVLKYTSDNELNRITFSKSDENWTLGFVLNEKEFVEVISTIKEAKKHDEVKEEIKKVFCEFVQKINK